MAYILIFQLMVVCSIPTINVYVNMTFVSIMMRQLDVFNNVDLLWLCAPFELAYYLIFQLMVVCSI